MMILNRGNLYASCALIMPVGVQESDMDVEPKPDANHNAHWQGELRALNEDDEDDAVNSPQDNCPRASGQAPGSHGLSRMQQQGLPAHGQPGHARAGSPLVTARQAKKGKNGNGSSDSGSNSPDIRVPAANGQDQAAPPMIAA